MCRDLRDRGLNELDQLATGRCLRCARGQRGAMCSPEPEQRCWVHKTANGLDPLPKRLQPRAKTLLHEMAEAPTRADARTALERFRDEFDAKYPKALTKLDKDWEQLTAFYDCPATTGGTSATNPIEISFARQAPHQGHQGRRLQDAGAAMAYKLLDAAQERWRRFNGHELVADVLAGVRFKDGIKVSDDDTTTTDEKVAA